MTTLDDATSGLPMTGDGTGNGAFQPIAFEDGTYQPGACNIGPAEIARRRRSGHVGLAAAVALLGALVVLDAPPVTRLLVAVPATVAASGYLQARLRFCTGFGSRGVFNFGAVGSTEQVADAEARRLDSRRSMQINGASVGAGIIAGVLAAALPT
jgi:hypothetical protein